MKAGIAVMLEVLTSNFENIVAVFYTAEEGPMVNNGLELLMPLWIMVLMLFYAL